MCEIINLAAERDKRKAAREIDAVCKLLRGGPEPILVSNAKPEGSVIVMHEAIKRLLRASV